MTYTIYIIEDDLSISRLLKEYIEKYGLSARVADFDVRDWSSTYVVYDEYEKKYGDNQASLFLSKSHIYETEKRAYGTIMFLSLFLGIIFFVASGSFIYNKFYMDQASDKQKYKQLHKIGVTFKEIKKSSFDRNWRIVLVPVHRGIHSFHRCFRSSAEAI